MPRQASPYQCDFCRDALVPTPVRLADVGRYLTLRRCYKCPHCFDEHVRPFAWIGRIPLLGRLFTGTRARKPRAGVFPQRPGDFSPTRRRLAAAGRWVAGKDSVFSDTIAKMFRLLLRPFRRRSSHRSFRTGSGPFRKRR